MTADLTRRLTELIEEHEVPGAQVAVLAGGEIAEAAAGVLNTATGVAVTTDSVFQIGSVTKTWTATLVMQLVADGLIELDAPVRRYLPEFRLGDAAATAAITVRQLLDHTSGIEGDLFLDTGRGSDAVARLVAALGEAGQVHRPGELFSYCNSGYVVLGRLLEVLRGKPFDEVLRERLIGPLGLRQAAVDADEAILFRAAVGHLPGAPGQAMRPAPVWALAASNAPAGARLSMSAGDLVRYAGMHLAGGVAPDGTRVLPESVARAMTRPQVALPDIGYGSHWGLGWQLFDPAGSGLFGHDGSTIGQNAYLRIAPGGVAVALLTNGGNTSALCRDLLGELLFEHAGIRLPEPARPPVRAEPVDAAWVSGVYRSAMAEHVVEVDSDGRAWLRTKPLTELAALVTPPARVELVRLRSDLLITAAPARGRHAVYALLGGKGNGNGEGGGSGARFLHASRAMPRQE
ncbi:class A beta-lactamase-related serine hydrolase [Nocardia yunnanensis]|uniref:Class A beta-lactamase-related serine hydrolase n=1 Tax=Nocardia yunnanensis TaxID=2382165 RepID=A0A386Z5Q1_9NOCA|nr:serine hydrolase domain-containing protein [Nocardia yunnanensis]AYF73048.1 class A beta-lactamase-related serine hydrolase [Nocardia yunnanensis]